MSRNRSNSTSNFNQTLKKFSLSAFVVLAFIAYAIHERLTNSSAAASTASTAPTSGASLDASGSSAGAPASNIASNAPSSTSSVQQAPAPSSGSTTASGYKNGTFTGPAIDVNYGLVQVQATVQNGKIAAVQFLQYPSDRRTSQQINAFAMPNLQQEAIQEQSANVNIISGATLTSEGFAMSLQSALANAH
jgi:uncharacterized protein with FMN-binding domain